MLNNKQAVLFDLDGTLVDSMWLWTAVDETYFAEKGIAVSEIEEFQKELEGMGFTDTAVFFKEKFGIEDSIDTIKKRWVELAQDK